MRQIQSYLDQKAARIPQLSKTDPMPYATANELSEALRTRVDTVCNALSNLRRHNLIRMYPIPSPKIRNRKYGSLKLPEATFEEIYGRVSAEAKMMAPIIVHARIGETGRREPYRQIDSPAGETIYR